MSFTLHIATKRTHDGFVPMLTVRGAGGRMVGSYTPQGARRDTCTFVDAAKARVEASLMALRVVQARPDMFRTA